MLAGKHDDEFPLVVWQTGSGTQTNMNVNEVLANRASELLGGAARRGAPGPPQRRREQEPVVQRRVSRRRCTWRRWTRIRNRLLPSLMKLKATLAAKSEEFKDIVKIGRTHLQDATPLTLGQEFSGYVAQLEQADRHLHGSLPHLCELALGGTAVGHRPERARRATPRKWRRNSRGSRACRS